MKLLEDLNRTRNITIVLVTHEEDIAAFLPQATAAMLAGIDDPAWPEREGTWHGLQALARQRWPWAMRWCSSRPR